MAATIRNFAWVINGDGSLTVANERRGKKRGAITIELPPLPQGKNRMAGKGHASLSSRDVIRVTLAIENKNESRGPPNALREESVAALLSMRANGPNFRPFLTNNADSKRSRFTGKSTVVVPF